jgi:sulfatase maturation enzyme AslB (radical SAM superfamily)/polysaccharide pyruvyl transferase WcaK-like protein
MILKIKKKIQNKTFKKALKRALIKINLRVKRKIYKYFPHLGSKAKTKKMLAEISYYTNQKELNPKQNTDPIKIEVINFNVTDICNSGCAMCNIWQQLPQPEITPMELEKVLADPLFDNLLYVGLTGGEPTLRDDLYLLYETIIKAKPGIVGLSAITNCINTDEVIMRIDEAWETCRKFNKDFSLMISLDGVDAVHDNVRGTIGNFKSAIYVYNYFKNKGLSISTGTTISKLNVWDVDELLDYLKENNMYGRFRIAEFINRLYNEKNSYVIRNFDADETYHLILFFYKLIVTFEKDETYQRTYYSIINMLGGGKRIIGCPYHSNGVVLSSKGEIAYCAPKSKVLGSAIEKSAFTLYNENLSHKQQILDHNCDNCIHDYHAPITVDETLSNLTKNFWKEYIKIGSLIDFNHHKKVLAIKKSTNLQVFITGWYGTETVGDKAILGGIIDDVKAEYTENVNIVVSSLYPHITLRTLKELNINAEVIDAYSEDFVGYSKGSDLVIMGGGPLMDLDELALPLIAFKLAKSAHKKTKIYGCGIGPLFNDKLTKSVKEILNYSDEILLRDSNSVAMADKWLKNKKEVKLSGDFAKKYLMKYFTDAKAVTQEKVLSCYLRELTHEYFGNLSETDFLDFKTKFESNLAKFIKDKANEHKVDKIYFEHMHNFVVGGDDRDFSRYFINTYFESSSIPVTYNKKLSTIESIVSSMQTSTLNVCMRFHSVLFAETLKTDFIALDYTDGGKIYNYLSDNKILDKLLTVDTLIQKY